MITVCHESLVNSSAIQLEQRADCEYTAEKRNEMRTKFVIDKEEELTFTDSKNNSTKRFKFTVDSALQWCKNHHRAAPLGMESEHLFELLLSCAIGGELLNDSFVGSFNQDRATAGLCGDGKLF